MDGSSHQHFRPRDGTAYPEAAKVDTSCANHDLPLSIFMEFDILYHRITVQSYASVQINCHGMFGKRSMNVRISVCYIFRYCIQSCNVIVGNPTRVIKMCSNVDAVAIAFSNCRTAE